jgi:hypothetical protein
MDLVSLTLMFMKALKRMSFKQYSFYSLVFLFGFLYQPNWVNDNFWLKADFYEVLPFQVPYILFLSLYSTASVLFIFQVIRLVKKHL